MDTSGQSVIVAMSGGVDSSVAAAMLLEQGYRVTGVFMCLGTAGAAGGLDGGAADRGSRGCCSPQDAADARRVAERLGIELYVLNLADEFGPIIEDFAREYAAGRTPNPCIHCNARIKFGRLIRHADSLGVQYVATGHYARMVNRGQVNQGQVNRGLRPIPSSESVSVPDLPIAREKGGQTPISNGEIGLSPHFSDDAGPLIARGLARGKDQSYALFGIARQNLGRILLPVGMVPDKPTLRRRALELGLAVHDKPDSQEICFVPDDDYVSLLARLAPQALTPGPVVNSSGKLLGRHEGYARFTIGQRKGLRIAGPVPMYVTKIDPATATVTLGPREQVLGTRLRATGANWHVVSACGGPSAVGCSFDATVQIRYNHSGAPARVTVTSPDAFEVEFAQPVPAITPGQAAVVYDGDQLLGGGWIA
jgi:tRNA-specific 2-thiouridylase